jgi:hypothetical protein
MKTLEGTTLINTISLNDGRLPDLPVFPVWILGTGYWDDSLNWDDGEAWQDG